MNFRSFLLLLALRTADAFVPGTGRDVRRSSCLSVVASRPVSSPASSQRKKRRLRKVQQLERQYNRPTSKGLTRQEEVDCSLAIRTFRAALQVREQLTAASGNNQEPSTKQWAQACGVSTKELRRLLEQGQAARTAVVDANVGLVVDFAKRQSHALGHVMNGGIGTILTLQDMIQEGNLGLMEAAERFDPAKGFRFSTYATWWVRQRILRAISDSSRTIRLPAHVHGTLQKMYKAKVDLKRELGRDATTEELSRYLDVPAEKLNLYAASSRNVLSLERPLHSASFKDDERTLGDTLASDAPTPEEDVQADYLRRDIRALIDTALEDTERQVIVCRFGLEDGKPLTLQETAHSLGLTRDQVRLTEARALNKLRQPQRKHKLKEYVHGESPTTTSTVSGAIPEQKAPARTKKGGDSRLWFF